MMMKAKAVAEGVPEAEAKAKAKAEAMAEAKAKVKAKAEEAKAKAKAEEAKAKADKAKSTAATRIWWDINRCPVPSDIDVRRVGPCIKRELEKLGYYGPLTIIAVGILTDVPHDFLREIYSSGIALHHVPTDVAGLNWAVLKWTWYNRPPANLMLISDYPDFFGTLDMLSNFGFHIVPCIFPYDPQQAASASASASVGCFRWESLLESLRADAMDSGPPQEDKCSETVEPALYCGTCLGPPRLPFNVRGFENFSMHLKSEEHAEESLGFHNEDEDKGEDDDDEDEEEEEE